MAKIDKSDLYKILKAPRRALDLDDLVNLFSLVSQQRVEALSNALCKYIQVNLATAISRRNGLGDYRTNPYVLMTSASLMNLDDSERFANFLFNNKLYMGLETSFGKSVESVFLGPYPLTADEKWSIPKEKLAEFKALEGLSNQQKALKRTESLWREIDTSFVSGHRRYLMTIKSGPNTINDTQVQAMTAAIRDCYLHWSKQTRENCPDVNELDIVIGLSYGTEKTTNNKENQILAKLLACGFTEEDPLVKPGVLIDDESGSVRVYRYVGKQFWGFVGNPDNPTTTEFVFLEVLLALAKALAMCAEGMELEDQVNLKLDHLITALANLRFPKKSLPDWVREDFSEKELFWFATAMTAFYDEGI